jgi:HSP20 family molecular chaperone IbpA
MIDVLNAKMKMHHLYLRNTIQMYPAATSKIDIYPGMYQPEPGTEQQVEKANDEPPTYGHLRSQVIESDDLYTVRLNLNILEKENLFVYTTPSHLLIYCRCLNNKHPAGLTKYMVDLPLDADTNFASAEFTKGVLTIYLSKKANQMKNYPGRIIVY